MSDTPKVVSEELLRAYQDGLKRYHNEMGHQAQRALEANIELTEVKRDREKWREMAYRMRADRDAYRKERDESNKRIKWYANQVLNFATDDIPSDETGLAVDLVRERLGFINAGGWSPWTDEYKELLRQAVEDA